LIKQVEILVCVDDIIIIKNTAACESGSIHFIYKDDNSNSNLLSFAVCLEYIMTDIWQIWLFSCATINFLYLGEQCT